MNKKLNTAAKLAALGAVAMLAGCAFVPDTIRNDYQPPKNIGVVNGAENISVHVLVKNDRVGKTEEDRDRLGYTKDTYGFKAASYYMHIRKDFTAAIESALQSRGFHTGSNGVLVNIDVEKFKDQESMGLVVQYFHPVLVMKVSVPESGYSTTIYVNTKYVNSFGNGLVGGAGRSGSANKAMKIAIDNMVSNPKLIKAIFVASGQIPKENGVVVP